VAPCKGWPRPMPTIRSGVCRVAIKRAAPVSRGASRDASRAKPACLCGVEATGVTRATEAGRGAKARGAVRRTVIRLDVVPRMGGARRPIAWARRREVKRAAGAEPGDRDCRWGRGRTRCITRDCGRCVGRVAGAPCSDRETESATVRESMCAGCAGEMPLAARPLVACPEPAARVVADREAWRSSEDVKIAPAITAAVRTTFGAAGTPPATGAKKRESSSRIPTNPANPLGLDSLFIYSCRRRRRARNRSVSTADWLTCSRSAISA
jgi:hypothetical protein